MITPQDVFNERGGIKEKKDIKFFFDASATDLQKEIAQFYLAKGCTTYTPYDMDTILQFESVQEYFKFYGWDVFQCIQGKDKKIYKLLREPILEESVVWIFQEATNHKPKKQARYQIFNIDQCEQIVRAVAFRNEVMLQVFIKNLLFRKDGEDIGLNCRQFQVDEMKWKKGSRDGIEFDIGAWENFLFPLWINLCEEFKIIPHTGVTYE